MLPVIPFKLGLQQRMLPIYRADFFELLGKSSRDGLSVFAGNAMESETVTAVENLMEAKLVKGQNIHLLKGKLYTCWQIGLMNWLKAWDPDVLIVEANPRYLHSPAAIHWMRRRDRPVIGWGLGTGGFVKSGSVELLVWEKYLATLDGIISYSHTGSDEYKQAGMPENAIFVAPNAVLPAPVDEISRMNHFSEEGPIILYIGRLQARKRVDSLIKACGELNKQSKLQLWIIGDGPERADLENLAARVFPGVRFLGPIHGKETEPYFRKADLFVLPGTGGLAVQEAMAYSLPVIVGQADGTQSNLVRESNGYVLRDDKVETLIETLRLAITDPARLRAMGKQSYAIVKNEVNLEKMVEAFASAILWVREKGKP